MQCCGSQESTLSLSHNNPLSFKAITSYSSLCAQIMTTTNDMKSLFRITKGGLNKWLTIDCHVENLDSCAWGGRQFNRSDHRSPWVEACCQATKIIGCVVGDESTIPSLQQLRCCASILNLFITSTLSPLITASPHRVIEVRRLQEKPSTSRILHRNGMLHERLQHDIK